VHRYLRLLVRASADGALVLLLLGFAYANFESARRSGRPTGLGATILELTTVVAFVSRRRASVVTERRFAWVAAAGGTFLMLLARPGPQAATPALEAVQLVGLCVAASSLGILGRSFGVVAANRGVKSAGLYRFVRHPTYLGYLIAWSAYVVQYATVRNGVLLAAATLFQLARIRQEERLLDHDAAYREYRARVRYRLVPRVY
jgi:protein-S-isoprenylcysteine O-methyltransferase Ste14